MADHRLRQLPAPFLTRDLPDEHATARLAGDIAMILKPGDTVCLSGDLGAGKSTFTRALIRAFAEEPELEVPSPTFTLVQTYALPRCELSHFDLYRLDEPEELEELGLEDLLETGAALIEWPEKAEPLLPETALWIQITQPEADSDGRRFEFVCADPDWQARVTRTLDMRAFLGTAGFGDAARAYLAGDASLRSFETVAAEDRCAVLMSWPFRDGAVSEEVRAYMAKVHLAQDCRSVLAIGSELRKRGFRAAEIYAAAPDQGFVLSEDLGRDTVLVDGKPDPDRYLAAVELLAKMHGESWPQQVSLPGGSVYCVPDYSPEALIAEASLFLDWYVPHATGAQVTQDARLAFETLWQHALDGISEAQQGWVLRDFHSPNLLWQQGASGLDRIGLIDLQDTVRGPVAYDVAALLFDARTDVDAALETRLYEAYLMARHLEQGPGRDLFAKAYGVMAAQRISKILGIFVRLARRDNKPAYLSHLPRMLGYLDRVLDRPGMTDLKEGYARFRR